MKSRFRRRFNDRRRKTRKLKGGMIGWAAVVAMIVVGLRLITKNLTGNTPSSARRTGDDPVRQWIRDTSPLNLDRSPDFTGDVTHVPDIHASGEQLGAWAEDGIIASADNCTYTATEDRYVIFNGDECDRGDACKKVMDCLDQMQQTAPPGKVTRVIGNHCALSMSGDDTYAHPDDLDTGHFTKEGIRRRTGIMKGKMVAVHYSNGILTTHAGVREDVYDKVVEDAKFTEFIENPAYVSEVLEKSEIQPRPYPAMFADFMNYQLWSTVAAAEGLPTVSFDGTIFGDGNGVLWTRDIFGTIPGVTQQTIGHTIMTDKKAKQVGCVWHLDTGNNHFKIMTVGKFKMKKGKPTEFNFYVFKKDKNSAKHTSTIERTTITAPCRPIRAPKNKLSGKSWKWHGKTSGKPSGKTSGKPSGK